MPAGAPVIAVRSCGRATACLLQALERAKHTTHVERYHSSHFELKRGQIARIHFAADTPGVFEIHRREHEPTMTGYLTVLPR